MLGRLFPKQFDNTYRGHWLAIWLFVPVILLQAAQDVIVILSPRETLITADALPLYSYGSTGAQTVIALAAMLAFVDLVIPLQSLLVLIRYRAMIPFLYLCSLIFDIGSRVLKVVNPIAHADAPTIAAHAQNGFYVAQSGTYISYFILAMTFAGFALSLVDRSSAPTRPLAENTN
ncbi:MAG: hypothetical protein HY243_14440 [Proteobacteria bacterium]|nr:hypothetical protein [Pseudomonadota bacterium]